MFNLGAPIIRFDNPHGGKGVSQFPHINIDPNGVPNARNPHIKVPKSLIACADKVDKVLKGVSKALLVVALVTDGLRICAAIYEDMTSDDNHILPHQTIKTIASIAGGWSGGAVGATGGALLGAKIGACVGSLFGGVGAVIGTPIGAIVGGIAGGIAGGLLGSYLAEEGAQKGLDYFEANAAEWNDYFITATQALINPSGLVNEIVKGDNPEKVKEAKGALIGMGVGAAVAAGMTYGTVLGPFGTIAGGAVGAIYGVWACRHKLF
ncbi:unnamed protein product [Didymodactylos carnosus]|uniref:Glycine zipper domain-containing protein n=1 Tax=Didymodactylos carnosus TaxID=1234261 RepID=A0A8S2F285_9BILA|nr:unnamed protein product [Didymodactylos carnosus]CAF4131473.1 unnamed protein product [Didymodactylos carnosus]